MQDVADAMPRSQTTPATRKPGIRIQDELADGPLGGGRRLVSSHASDLVAMFSFAGVPLADDRSH